VPSPDALHADLSSLDEPGEVSVHGVAFTIPTSADSGGRLDEGGTVTWRRLDLPALRATLPYPIHDVYLLEARDSVHPRLPMRLEPPPLDDGPHLSYAIQWFAFAITALVVGWILASRTEGQRGRGAATSAPPPSTAAARPAASSPPPPPAASP